MAGKEATVYIVDCGRTMGESSHGRKESNLDWALEYVWDKITTAMATGRKTLLAGIVGLRTDGSSNDLDSEEDYQHISVYHNLAQMQMENVRKLRNDLVVSNTEAGDAISSLVIAIQMITETCKKLQYLRRIVLVTDARGSMQADDLGQITAKLKEDKIELIVLGVDFDDAEYGFKEESKDSMKAENEELLRTLCEDCEGIFGTLAQAVEELQIPRVKTTRPVPSYKGYLTLGNPETYETAMSIGVERYPKTMQAKPPTASKFVVRGDIASQSQASSATMANGEGGGAGGGDGLAAVKSTRAYQIEDEEVAGGKREIASDDLSKGYEYGRTAVHISESDRNVTTYETKPCLDIVGFVEKSKYERYLDMDRTNLIVPAKGDDKAAMALSSLIHGLYELDSYAIVRLVVKENKEPRILIMAPHIDPDFECLYDTELPFAEDVRSYKFPPLDRVLTVSGKTLTLHRNLPSDDLQDAMSQYVDSMDLSTFGKDDEGEEAEYAPIDETFSPMLHRIHQVTKHRAVHPNAEPPAPYDILTKYSQPPADLVKRSQKSLNAVIEAAQVKKVPPKARGRKFGRKGRDAEKPLSDLDVNALLAQDPNRQKKRIDAKNAIPEFKQILTNSEDLEEVKEACTQLKRIFFDWIKYSTGDVAYGRAIEAIRVMREETLNLEMPGLYNEMLKEMKEKILQGDLGGERREMWWRVRVNRLYPISEKECEESEVSEEKAKEMMSVAATKS